MSSLIPYVNGQVYCSDKNRCSSCFSCAHNDHTYVVVIPLVAVSVNLIFKIIVLIDANGVYTVHSNAL